MLDLIKTLSQLEIQISNIRLSGHDTDELDTIHRLVSEYLESNDKNNINYNPK